MSRCLLLLCIWSGICDVGIEIEIHDQISRYFHMWFKLYLKILLMMMMNNSLCRDHDLVSKESKRMLKYIMRCTLVATKKPNYPESNRTRRKCIYPIPSSLIHLDAPSRCLDLMSHYPHQPHDHALNCWTFIGLRLTSLALTLCRNANNDTAQTMITVAVPQTFQNQTSSLSVLAMPLRFIP